MQKKVTEVREKNLARPNADEITILENKLAFEINEMEKFYTKETLNSDNISIFRKEIGDTTKAIETVLHY